MAIVYIKKESWNAVSQLSMCSMHDSQTIYCMIVARADDGINLRKTSDVCMHALNQKY